MVMEKFDIGLVGWWYGCNYGSMLTYYALHQVLRNLGYSVLMIHEALGYEKGRAKLSTNDAPHIFAKKHYQFTDQVNFKELSRFNDICNTFIVGSDQLWNPYISRVNSDCFLDFTADEIKRISYGTSFGNKGVIKANLQFVKDNYKYIRRFDAISVREEYAVDVARESFGVKAVCVVDPVFLPDISEYIMLADQATCKVEGKYLLAFILDPTEEKRNVIIKIADTMSFKKIFILTDPYQAAIEKAEKIFNESNMEMFKIDQISPENFLNVYRNAEYVVTDSFHGVCFSYIFRKNFNVFFNIPRGADRFENVVGLMGLENRRIYEDEHTDLDLSEINYSKAEENVNQLRDMSIEWLKNAVETPKEQLPSIMTPEASMTDLLYQNPEFIKIRLLATLLRDYGVKHVILSPGGRDVPLVRMFEYNESSFILHRITDERSAAYYGMGIAAQLRQPVACVCTSGTAASNYLPAVTEAYYTGIPLIVITADRQQVYLNHGEDQTIPQKHIYDGVIKKSVTLPEAAGYKAEYQTRRDISDCILETKHNGFGPVHINIAIDNISMGAKVPREYWKLLPWINPHILRVGANDGEKRMLQWVTELKKSERILVVYGQNPPPTEKQLKNIEKFTSKYNCVIVTDFISNLDCAYSLQSYNMLQAISNDEFNKQLSPDILITVGGKRLMNDPLTFKIRGGLKNIRHWSVIPNGKIMDFYFRLTSVLEMSQDFFFEWFSSQAGDIINNGVFYNKWKKMTEKYSAPEITGFNAHYVQSRFIPIVPENSLLHLGVGQSFIDSRRYSMKRNVEVFCNMGTNGIDGCTSTFLGQCSVIKERLCFLLIGDLSFFYDMNSIWNKKLDKNVRILMVNNSGSGLLRGHNLKGVTAIHNTSARGWVETVNFEYVSASKKEEYDEKLKYFVSDEPKQAVFFEVFCG